MMSDQIFEAAQVVRQCQLRLCTQPRTVVVEC